MQEVILTIVFLKSVYIGIHTLLYRINNITNYPYYDSSNIDNYFRLEIL